MMFIFINYIIYDILIYYSKQTKFGADCEYLKRIFDMLLPDMLEHFRRVLCLKLTTRLQTLVWLLVLELNAG